MADSQMIQLLTNERKLLAELIWSFCTAPFVVGIHLRPKSRLSCIKSNEDMGRLDALQEMTQHEVKAIDRIGMQTIGIFEAINLMIECEKGTKSDGRPVDE